MEEIKETPKKENLRRCPKCNSSFGYYALREKAWRCRSCGYLNKEEVKE